MSVRHFFRYGLVGGLTGAAISGGLFAWMMEANMAAAAMAMYVGVLSAIACAIYGGIVVTGKPTQQQKERGFDASLTPIVLIPLIIISVLFYMWTHSPHAIP